MEKNNLLDRTTEQISEFSDTSFLDAQSLLAHITGQERSYILAHPEMELTAKQSRKLDRSLARLKKGIPLPYVLGHWEFFGLELKVSQDVLIPRPETELLVEKALEWLTLNPTRNMVMDIGTGSGCIAVSLADRLPDLQLIASDFSRKALKIAKQNARMHHVSGQIEFVCCNLFPSLDSDTWKRFISQGQSHSKGADLILANLPYIPTSKLMELKIYGKEPDIALDGGEDGLDVIRRFIAQAPAYLAPGGRILMEIEATQGMAALSLAYDQFSEARIHLHQDLAGHDRILEILLKP